MKNLRFVILLIFCVSLFSCSSPDQSSQSEPDSGDVLPAEDSIHLETINARKITMAEDQDQTLYKGIQYEVILTTSITDRQLSQLGVGLQFSGQLRQYWGKSGSGYSSGFSILDETDSNKKILVSFPLVKQSTTDHEIDQVLSSDYISDLNVQLFFKGTPYLTLHKNIHNN
ncbi:hypothetical protein [Paenibacillus kobensis]|uniref:hypothetical protein n=1 Tax=Paenibacillus kobensis TaxID=59841 RepID=UPI000FDB8EB5|nr:hypothetical protein [Paenibacillus kobensis]